MTTHGDGHHWSFRTRLTFRWTLAFGLILALAQVAIYLGARLWSYAELDAQVRTLAATELASAVDEWQGIHLHEMPVLAPQGAAVATKFAQVLSSEGHVVMQTTVLTQRTALLDVETIGKALRGEAPLVDVEAEGRPGRMVGLTTIDLGKRYVVAVGLFRDSVDAMLARLAWLLSAVWLIGLVATSATGFALASRALQPIDLITARAAAVTRGDFAARLDPPRVDDEIGRMTRLLNEMLARLNGAIEANRHFAADASHELRSPLTAMAGEIDVALRRPRTEQEYRDTLLLVRERLADMVSLIEDLMLLARAEDGAPGAVLREIETGPLVTASAARLGALAAERGVTLAVGSGDTAVAYADERLLSRALDNVIANAIHYNREGGHVTIATGIDAAADIDSAASVWIRVRDDGPGVPEAEWERIFERFFRLDQSRSRRTGGSGLGLAICRAILTLFRGTIGVVESSSQGTTIELRLPGRHADARAQRAS
jgi:two-component system OmpR family sensor kinase